MHALSLLFIYPKKQASGNRTKPSDLYTVLTKYYELYTSKIRKIIVAFPAVQSLFPEIKNNDEMSDTSFIK